MSWQEINEWQENGGRRTNVKKKNEQVTLVAAVGSHLHSDERKDPTHSRRKKKPRACLKWKTSTALLETYLRVFPWASHSMGCSVLTSKKENVCILVIISLLLLLSRLSSLVSGRKVFIVMAIPSLFALLPLPLFPLSSLFPFQYPSPLPLFSFHSLPFPFFHHKFTSPMLHLLLSLLSLPLFHFTSLPFSLHILSFSYSPVLSVFPFSLPFFFLSSTSNHLPSVLFPLSLRLFVSVLCPFSLRLELTFHVLSFHNVFYLSLSSFLSYLSLLL